MTVEQVHALIERQLAAHGFTSSPLSDPAGTHNYEMARAAARNVAAVLVGLLDEAREDSNRWAARNALLQERLDQIRKIAGAERER